MFFNIIYERKIKRKWSRRSTKNNFIQQLKQKMGVGFYQELKIKAKKWEDW